MAKTFKMLPVMLVGMVVSRKRHSLQEVCVVTGPEFLGVIGGVKEGIRM